MVEDGDQAGDQLSTGRWCAEAYTVVSQQLLAVAAPGVLANDSDTDSPVPFIGRRAVLVTGPAHGTLTLNADGSFTYTSAGGFSGIDTFVYKADDGLSVAPDLPEVPLSAFSADITVTITVTALPPPPSSALFLHGNGRSTLPEQREPDRRARPNSRTHPQSTSMRTIRGKTWALGLRWTKHENSNNS